MGEAESGREVLGRLPGAVRYVAIADHSSDTRSLVQSAHARVPDGRRPRRARTGDGSAR